MHPRQLIHRRIELLRMIMDEAPRRHEPDEAFAMRIADEVERLALRLVDDCAELRGGARRVWEERAARQSAGRLTRLSRASSLSTGAGPLCGGLEVRIHQWDDMSDWCVYAKDPMSPLNVRSRRRKKWRCAHVGTLRCCTRLTGLMPFDKAAMLARHLDGAISGMSQVQERADVHQLTFAVGEDGPLGWSQEYRTFVRGEIEAWMAANGVMPQ